MKYMTYIYIYIHCERVYNFTLILLSEEREWQSTSFFFVSYSFYNEQVVTLVIRNKAWNLLCFSIFICLTSDGKYFLVLGSGLGWSHRT